MERIDTKPHNAYLEKLTTLSLIPDVYNKRFLDAGCGTGVYTEWLVERGADVIAVDAHPKMLKHARRCVGYRAEVKQNDLRRPMNFIENNFLDIVLSSLVLNYIEDLKPVFNEFHKILQK